MFLPFSNLQVKHWNPGATMPLILPVQVICNTSDEDLHANITVNSRRPGEWLAQASAHDGIAVLCGSGPSLADDLPEIRERVSAGAKLFAMNGAAKYLADNGLLPDYQLIIDPREATADLVGPAKQHMFASQVHPACFEKAPSASVWHLQIEGIDDLLPKYDKPFALIGGAASVGNTATCVAYTMGYRELHLYGYDSSHRDNQSHAFRQPMNDGEPCAQVLFNGREYFTSLTMKLQAEKFQQTARALEDAGCKVFVHGSGLLPDMWNAPVEDLTEREKYERMWAIPGYRNIAPGEECVGDFIAIAKPTGVVIDFGCGTGRAAIKLAEAGCEPILVDFAANCRDPQAQIYPFFQLDLSEDIPLRAEYGLCTDVMEHIPPEDVVKVIGNIMTSARNVFFQISTVPDMAGAAINQRLHLTVMPHGWWHDLFTQMGYTVAFHREGPDASQFLVTRTA